MNYELWITNYELPFAICHLPFTIYHQGQGSLMQKDVYKGNDLEAFNRQVVIDNDFIEA